MVGNIYGNLNIVFDELLPLKNIRPAPLFDVGVIGGRIESIGKVCNPDSKPVSI
ncbi:MAG: hypothetical protein OXE99_04595 [Cellvibrionales bacterium]|nr:hypothetical protein [Cellvibrionales bacterium]